MRRSRKPFRAFSRPTRVRIPPPPLELESARKAAPLGRTSGNLGARPPELRGPPTAAKSACVAQPPDRTPIASFGFGLPSRAPRARCVGDGISPSSRASPALAGARSLNDVQPRLFAAELRSTLPTRRRGYLPAPAIGPRSTRRPSGRYRRTGRGGRSPTRRGREAQRALPLSRESSSRDWVT